MPVVDAVFAGVGKVDKDVVALVNAMGIAPFGDDFAESTNWVSARVGSATDSRQSPFVDVNRTLLGNVESVVFSPRIVWTEAKLTELREASVAFLSGDADWPTVAAAVE